MLFYMNDATLQLYMNNDLQFVFVFDQYCPQIGEFGINIEYLFRDIAV